jgi:hypothetical protein
MSTLQKGQKGEKEVKVGDDITNREKAVAKRENFKKYRRDGSLTSLLNDSTERSKFIDNVPHFFDKNMRDIGEQGLLESKHPDLTTNYHGKYLTDLTEKELKRELAYLENEEKELEDDIEAFGYNRNNYNGSFNKLKTKQDYIKEILEQKSNLTSTLHTKNLQISKQPIDWFEHTKSFLPVSTNDIDPNNSVFHNTFVSKRLKKHDDEERKKAKIGGIHSKKKKSRKSRYRLTNKKTKRRTKRKRITKRKRR